MITGGSDGTAKVWDSTSGEQQLDLTGHLLPVVDVQFSPDGTRILTMQMGTVVWVWDATTGTQLYALPSLPSPELRGWSHSALFSPDGNSIVLALGDDSARTFDTADGHLLRTFTAPGQQIQYAGFSPDGTMIATAVTPPNYAFGAVAVTVWDATTGDVAYTLADRWIGVPGIVFSPDGRSLLTAGMDGKVKLWDAATGELRASVVEEPTMFIAASFSPDSATFLAIDGPNFDIGTRIRTWDATTLALVTNIEGHGIGGAEFSPDSQSFLVRTENSASLWDSTTGVQRVRFDVDGLTSTAVSPDGTRVVTGSSSGAVVVWRVPAEGQECRDSS